MNIGLKSVLVPFCALQSTLKADNRKITDNNCKIPTNNLHYGNKW